MDLGATAYAPRRCWQGAARGRGHDDCRIRGLISAPRKSRTLVKRANIQVAAQPGVHVATRPRPFTDQPLSLFRSVSNRSTRHSTTAPPARSRTAPLRDECPESRGLAFPSPLAPRSAGPAPEDHDGNTTAGSSNRAAADFSSSQSRLAGRGRTGSWRSRGATDDPVQRNANTRAVPAA
jgi:hypothetical protein